MSATQFLEQLEQLGLLDEAMIADLKRQVAKSTDQVSAEKVAKLLVKKGHLTSFQAKKLLGSSTSTSSPKPSPAASQPPASDPKSAAPQQDDLALAEDDEEIVSLEAVDEPHQDQEAGSPVAAQGDLTEADLTEDDLTEGDLTEGDLTDGDLTDGDLTEEDLADGDLAEADLADDNEEELEEAIVLSSPDDGGGLTPLDDGGGPPPLDDLFGDDSAMGNLAEEAAESNPLLPTKPVRTNPWDSSLLLIGGGGLILLLMAGVVLYFALTRGTASEMFQLAEDDYRSQSYGQAIDKYDRYLKRFPKDANVSLARVRRGMARLRQVVEGSGDPQQGLNLAGQVLPEIEDEEAFSEARAELASLLPQIAEGFASRAKLAEQTEQAEQDLEQAEEAMSLVNNPSYIPTTLRKTQEARINTILEDLAVVRRGIRRDHELVEALQAIREAVGEGRTGEAHEVRRTLLKQYPGLARNEELVAAVLQISQRERELVEVVEEPLVAGQQDQPAGSQMRVVLAARRGTPLEGVENQVVFVLARGSVYGLEATSGRVLWRRFVGYETAFHPVPLSPEVGADVLVVDSRRHQLLRLEAQSGKLVWSLPLDEPFADPVRQGNRLLVATVSGRLWEVDPESGEAARYARFAQPLGVGPAVDPGRPQLYQVGEHSNVYVLSKDTFQCQEVFHLGHRSGSVAVPPAASLGHLLVAENGGADFCRLHVLATDSSGLELQPRQDPIRLEGHVVVPPLQYGRRVLVLTNLGAVYVLDVDPAQAERPVSVIARLVATSKRPMISYPLADGGEMWVADRRLTKYEIQTSRGELVRKWIKDDGDTFVAPPQKVGNAVVHLRRPEGSSGISVSAVNSDNGSRLWQTHLGVPAGQVTVDTQRGQIHSISARAALFEITSEVLRNGYSDQPALTAAETARGLAFTQPVELGQGRVALTSATDPERILLYDPSSASASQRLRLVQLELPANARLTCDPVALDGGLLVPLDLGQVLLVDPQDGQHRAHPFQPRLEAGSRIVWRRPAVVGPDGRQFVLADDQGNLYRIGLQDNPQPHLAPAAQGQSQSPVISPLAAVGQTVYGVSRDSEGDKVVSFQWDDLAPGADWPLEGRLVWGPERVGDLVLVATDVEGLLCFDAGGEQRWVSPLPYGLLAGRPLPADSDLLLASRQGTVWRISGQTGQQLNKSVVGEPLGTGPVIFRNRLLLSGSDGALHVIPMLAAP